MLIIKEVRVIGIGDSFGVILPKTYFKNGQLKKNGTYDLVIKECDNDEKNQK